MATDRIIGFDYYGNVEGTMCNKCHKLFTKQEPTWLDGSEAEPIYREALKKRDPKKEMLIDCNECGNAIWGKWESE